jgi:MFS family permease
MQTSEAASGVSRWEQGKALGVASLGGMLEYFEFIIFVFLASQIAHHFTSPDMPEWLRLMQTFGIFAAGFFIRPVGGIIMAQLGDLVGRKRIFTMTLALMAVPTLIIGLLPGYEQLGIWAPIILLLCRLMQGISLGGELPGAISFVSEQVSGKRLVFGLGVLAASMCLGSLSGSMVVSSLTNLLGAEAMNDWGWRIPFIIGGVFGGLSVYLRRFTDETPVFKELKERRMLSQEAPFKVVVAQHRRNLLLAMILAAATTVVAASTQQFPITFFTSVRGLPLEGVSSLVTMMIGLTLLGNLLGGLLVMWRVIPLLQGYVLFQLVTLVCVFWAFTRVDLESLVLPFAILGVSGGISMGLSLTFLARAFPAHIRYTGLATCYNIPIAVFGGTALLSLTYLASLSPEYVPFYPAFFCVASIIAVICLWPHRQAISPFEENDPYAPKGHVAMSKREAVSVQAPVA